MDILALSYSGISILAPFLLSMFVVVDMKGTANLAAKFFKINVWFSY